jgi:hypothetical protein
MAYLVRSFQKTEATSHVQRLGSDPSMFIPLPRTPRQLFSGVIVIHGDDAYIFDLARMVPGKSRRVACGANGQQPVRDEVRIYVKPSSMRKRRATVTGFRGFSYCDSWTDVAK